MPFLHDQRFSEAFANTRHRVYGKRLLPFSLWHQHLMEHAQSPIIEGLGCTPADLHVAVRICSTPWNSDFVFPPFDPPSTVKLITSSIGHPFLKELGLFQAYLTDFMSGPKLWSSASEGGSDRDIDSILERSVYLSKVTSLTWQQIWTMPIGILDWVCVSAQKLEGADVPIWTPDDEVAFTKFKAERDAKHDLQAKERAAKEGTTYEAAKKRVLADYWKAVKEAKERAAAMKKQAEARRG